MKQRKITPQEKDLHSSILKGDSLALSKLYDLCGENVIRSLKSWYPKIAKKDDALIMEAVNQAFLSYYSNPLSFNQDLNSLERYLEMSADGDLKNIIKREKKHFNRIDLPEDVELQEKQWNSYKKDQNTTDDLVISAEMHQAVQVELSKHFKTEVDVSLARLVLAGERKTEIFVEVLQIESLSLEMQQEEVKRHKDRIKKVIERYNIEHTIKKLAL